MTEVTEASEAMRNPGLYGKTILRLTKEYKEALISFGSWRHGLAMYGIGLYINPDTGKLRVHRDAWAWGEETLPDEFVEYVRDHRDTIERHLKVSDSGGWIITPKEIERHLAHWREYDEGVRRLVYQKALELGVLSYVALKPWEEMPPLHETKEAKQRREALEFLETITENKNNIAGVGWEWDQGPGLNWCRCTYPDGRVSLHFFTSNWWEGLREQRCDCPARKFKPNKPCKHEQARLYEWQRRVAQKDQFGDMGSNYPSDSNG